MFLAAPHIAISADGEVGRGPTHGRKGGAKGNRERNRDLLLRDEVGRKRDGHRGVVYVRR